MGIPTVLQEQGIDWTNAIAYFFGSPLPLLLRGQHNRLQTL
jgi:hypothetical protein